MLGNAILYYAEKFIQYIFIKLNLLNINRDTGLHKYTFINKHSTSECLQLVLISNRYTYGLAVNEIF